MVTQCWRVRIRSALRRCRLALALGMSALHRVRLLAARHAVLDTGGAVAIGLDPLVSLAVDLVYGESPSAWQVAHLRAKVPFSPTRPHVHTYHCIVVVSCVSSLFNPDA
jgi:hypothetical protein